MENYFKTNQSLWDSKVAAHEQSDFYSLEAFKQGWCSLKSIEKEAIGSVLGKSLLHLQCHFGMDTLSWARMGAMATGVDFSETAVQLARNLNQELGLSARFIHANVLDLPHHLTEQFDVVFTSYGVLCWLDDLDKWAAIINHFLKPNGVFFIVEFHPLLMMYDFDNHKIRYNYFKQHKPDFEIVEGTYADRNADLKHGEYTWTYSIHEILMPLIRQGLIVETFQEYDYSPYNCFPNMQEVAPEQYVYGDVNHRLPHLFSLKMRKP